MADIKFHPLTDASVGDVYGSYSHPRNRQITSDGIAMVSQTHHQQLVEIKFPIDTIGRCSVLECGGTGRDALAWHRLGAGHVTHVDISRQNVERLRSFITAHNIDNFEVIHADLLTVDLPPEGFDIVRSRGVLHHLADPALGLARYKHWLRVGGLLHFNVYRGGTFYYFVVKALRSVIGHIPVEKLIQMAEGMAFSDALVGILVDDIYVPYIHTADPEIMRLDIARLDLEELWPRSHWAKVDHDVRYPDLPEKTQHLQWWLRNCSSCARPEEVAQTLDYHQGVDDWALSFSVPAAEGSREAMLRLMECARIGTDDDNLVRKALKIYKALHDGMATGIGTAETRHSELQKLATE